MSTLRELDEEVRGIGVATRRIAGETQATGKRLEEQARQIMYLTDGSRSGAIATQTVSESARCIQSAVAEMQRLANVCDSYVVKHGNA